MFLTVKDTVWGEVLIRRVEFQNDLWVGGEFVQVHKNEFTSRGFHYIPKSMIQMELGSGPDVSKMIYVSPDMFGQDNNNLATKEFKGTGFPQRFRIRPAQSPKPTWEMSDDELSQWKRKQRDVYRTEHYKIFVRQWKLNPTTEQLAINLGISRKKVWSIAKFLRSKKVFLPLKSDERHTKRPERKKINWTHFVRAVKGAKYAETAATMVGMELERFLFCCQFLQSKGVRLVIPPMDDCPDWLRIRAGNDLKQIISVRSKHGSGRNFKERWAGYAKKTVMNMAGCEWL
jgi:hypothetical protein